MYKYSFENWANGELMPDDLFDLADRGEMCPDDLAQIRKDQESAYMYVARIKLIEAQAAFRYRLGLSLDRDELLNMEIDVAKVSIDIFKTRHHNVYVEAVSGIHLVYQHLSAFDVVKYFFSPEKVDYKNTLLDFLIKVKFLKWLYWLKSGDSTSLEPCFQETLNSAKGKDIYERYKVNKEVDYPTFRKSLIDGIKNNFRLRVKEHLATQLEDLRCIPTKNRINHELLVNPTFFDFIKDERLSADKKESKSGGNSYKWQGDIVEVDTLYSSLIKGGFLPENTAEDNFKALFSGVPIRQISPLEWLGKTNLLAYLIDQLYILHKFPLNTNYWSIAQTCFANIKDLKQAKDNYLNNKSKPKPLRHEKIDLILESLAKGK